MEALGLRGLAVVVDLLDAIALGSGGIHIVVTDRPAAVRAELEARCPEGWAIEPLLSPERERLSTEAYAPPPEHGGRLLLAVVEPRDPSARPAMRALNDDREWMLRRATCAVVIVAGKDASDAEAACVRLQGLAPDLWSVRNRVHHVGGPDEPRGVIDELLDRLSPRFHGDRAAARRWLDGRSLVDDWVTYRLWRDGRLRAAWLDGAEQAGRHEVGRSAEGAFLEPRGSTQAEVLDRSPIGEAIAPERWPQPTWRSGQLESWQRDLVSELQAALRREALGVLWMLPGEPDGGAFEEALLALGLLESRYEVVIHLDARGGLGPAIARLLRAAGQGVESEGVIHGCRRLQGALGEANALLLVHEIGPLELTLLRGFTQGRAIVATVRAEPVATFCVAASEGRQEYARWVRGELSAWAGGVVVQAIREQTLQLDLRAALGKGRFVLVVIDSTTGAATPRSAWELLAENRLRAAALAVGGGGAVGIAEGRLVELAADEVAARERLRQLATELAGEPSVGAASEERFNSLGIRSSNVGRREEALRATQEAVAICRGLAEQRPDAFLPDLAWDLNNLGADLDALGRREEALRATQEAVDIRRGLAEERPDAFLPDLALSLWSLGLLHVEAGDHRRALEELVEAARLLRPAFERLPDAFRDQAVGTLESLRRVAREGSLPIPDDLSPWIAQVLDSSPEPEPPLTR